mmetsp:Transcript_304/g.642  ORF Transcript_304/g.642 Transcript_304/m.642 type:complete len:332 (+) Transcript_304:49-1044(+)
MKQTVAAVLLASARGIVIHAPAGSNFEFGSPKCPCVGVAGLDGTTEVKVSKNMTADFPADFGARCAAWDNKRNGAYCMPGQDPGADKGWCAEPYCFVDPCNCDLDVPPTLANSYLPDASYQGKGLWYSYVTCGGKDYWMDAETKKQKQEAKGICEKKVEEKKWGKEKCRCVGYDGTPGTVNVTIDKKELKYPADTGATCESWDAKRHPDCVGDKPADWCKQEWCYVDPCECELDVPPKTSSYLPSGMVNGKPVYFSYATCGTSDSFSATNKESCVFQKSQDNCTKLEKCAWDGKACLGKDIVKTCSAHSGAGAMKATLAVAMTFAAAVMGF